MADTSRQVRLITKQTSIPGRIPTGTTNYEQNFIRQGELAQNTADKKIFGFDGSNIFEFGINSFLYLTGGTIDGNLIVNNLSGASTYFDYYYSAGTPLENIFNLVNLQNGINTFTGGTSTFPTVNVTAATLNNLTVSANTVLASTTATTFSALTVSATTYTLPDATIPTAASGTLVLAGYNQQGFSVPRIYDVQGNRIEITRDNLLIARNVSGTGMTKGQVVYISGSTGTVPQLQLAKANSVSTIGIIGVCYDNISNNGYGRVMTLGDIESINMSAFNNGDTLYVSPTTAGSLTNVKPTYPNFAQQVGCVINNGSGNGVLGVFIRGIIGVLNGDNATLSSVTATTIYSGSSNLSQVFISTAATISYLNSSGETTNTGTTINVAKYTIWNISGLTSGDTISLSNVSSAIDGQPLTILIKDNGTSRALIFDSNFNFSTYLPAPAATTANKILKIYSTFSSINSKFNVDNWQDGF